MTYKTLKELQAGDLVLIQDADNEDVLVFDIAVEVGPNLVEVYFLDGEVLRMQPPAAFLVMGSIDPLEYVSNAAQEALREVPTLAQIKGIFLTEEDAYWASLPPEETCSICDALGHGYPGAGPCPLEERGFDNEYEDRRVFEMGF